MMTAQGKNIALREYRLGDAAHISSWRSDDETTRWMGRNFRVRKTTPEIEARLMGIIENPPDDSIFRVIADAETGEYLGGIDITSMDSTDRNGVLSIVIAERQNRNKGIASAAIRLLLNEAFTVYGLHKVELRVASGNRAAIRCYEKIGFVHEGRLREHVFVDGTFHDMLIMGILENEFRKTQAQS